MATDEVMLWKNALGVLTSKVSARFQSNQPVLYD